MRIRMLAVQYKQAYPGELGPNIVAVTDEYIDDANPDYFPAEVEKTLKQFGGDIESHAIVEFEVPVEQIDEALNPVHQVDAKIVANG